MIRVSRKEIIDREIILTLSLLIFHPPLDTDGSSRPCTPETEPVEYLIVFLKLYLGGFSLMSLLFTRSWLPTFTIPDMTGSKLSMCRREGGNSRITVGVKNYPVSFLYNVFLYFLPFMGTSIKTFYVSACVP